MVNFGQLARTRRWTIDLRDNDLLKLVIAGCSAYACLGCPVITIVAEWENETNNQNSP